MSKKPTHTHKYQKVAWGAKGTIVLRCMLVNCSHYLHPEMAINRKSICWKCGEPFVLNKTSVTKKRPKCQRCSVKVDVGLSMLDSLLEGLED